MISKTFRLVVCIITLMSIAPASRAEDREYLEVRLYHLKSAEKAKLFDLTMKDAVLPAMKRLGIGPVGVFAPQKPEEGKEVRYVVRPFNTLEAWATASDKLGGDSEFMAGAKDYLSTDKKDPVFDRVEVSLMAGFKGMPKLEIPELKKKDGGKRIFELRVYESHNELKAKLKVEMFNEGELDVFKKVGLRPVFFGETLAGKNMPNLTYMLVYEDDADKDAAWKAFLAHPDWKAMSGMEKYKDTVSKIIRTFLVATDYSQVK